MVDPETFFLGSKDASALPASPDAPEVFVPEDLASAGPSAPATPMPVAAASRPDGEGLLEILVELVDGVLTLICD